MKGNSERFKEQMFLIEIMRQLSAMLNLVLSESLKSCFCERMYTSTIYKENISLWQRNVLTLGLFCNPDHLRSILYIWSCGYSIDEFDEFEYLFWCIVQKEAGICWKQSNLSAAMKYIKFKNFNIFNGTHQMIIPMIVVL